MSSLSELIKQQNSDSKHDETKHGGGQPPEVYSRSLLNVQPEKVILLYEHKLDQKEFQILHKGVAIQFSEQLHGELKAEDIMSKVDLLTIDISNSFNNAWWRKQVNWYSDGTNQVNVVYLAENGVKVEPSHSEALKQFLGVDSIKKHISLESTTMEEVILDLLVAHVPKIVRSAQSECLSCGKAVIDFLVRK